MNSGEFMSMLLALWASAFNGEQSLVSYLPIHLKT